MSDHDAITGVFCIACGRVVDAGDTTCKRDGCRAPLEPVQRRTSQLRLSIELQPILRGLIVDLDARGTLHGCALASRGRELLEILRRWDLALPDQAQRSSVLQRCADWRAQADAYLKGITPR